MKNDSKEIACSQILPSSLENNSPAPNGCGSRFANEEDFHPVKEPFKNKKEDNKLAKRLINKPSTEIPTNLCVNSSKPKSLQKIIKKLPKKTTEITSGNNICGISQQYLGNSILNSCESSRFLLVKSGMGTGKTTAMKEIIASLPDDKNILFISPRQMLNLAMSGEFEGVYYYVDIKQTIARGNMDEARKMAKRMVVTPQSLGGILKHFPDIHYEYVVMDESQTIANMIVSTATGDKVGTIQALKRACELSSHVVAMDAHIDVETRELMSLLSGSESVGELNNGYKSWSDISVGVLSGGSYVARRDANDSLQIQALNSGLKIAICSSSAEYCDLRGRVLREMFPTLNILVILGKGKSKEDDNKKTERLLSNPETINEWDVVIFSPAVSVGVSFDIKNHVDKVFGVFPNTDGTGDVDDSIQAMARVRNPVLKQWTITLDNNKNVFSDQPNCPSDIAVSVLNRYMRTSMGAGVNPVVNDIEQGLIDLYSTCFYSRMNAKNNFYDFFLSRLDSMGCKLRLIQAETVEGNALSRELLEDAKEQKKQSIDKVKTTSRRIDKNEFRHIRAKKEHRPDEVTKDESDSFNRFIFEDKFNINCDKLSDEEVKTYLQLDDDGAIQKTISREISSSSSGFSKRYMKARIVGMGDSEAFKVDLLSDKLNFPMIRHLLHFTVDCRDGREYSHDDLRNGALVKFVSRHHKEITALRVITLPKNWRKKPALLLNHLLDMCGYNHESRQVRINGKRVYVFKAVGHSGVDALCDARIHDGRNWVERTESLMDIFDGDVGEVFTDKDVKNLQMPNVDIRFVNAQLKILPKVHHLDVMTEYKHRYNVMSDDNQHGIYAPERANEWLKEKIANIELITENSVLRVA